MKWFRLGEGRRRASSQNDLHWNPPPYCSSTCTATLALCLIKVPLLLYTTLDFLACGQKAIAFTMVGKSQYHTAFLESYQRTWNGDTCLIFMILFAYRKSHLPMLQLPQIVSFLLSQWFEIGIVFF